MAKPNEPSTTGATVTVALKHPNGIVIQAQEQGEAHEPVMGGGTRPIKVWRGTGKQYVINGSAAPHGETPKCLVVGGYAMTSGIPKDVWENWKETHADSPLLQSGLIFAHENAGHSEGHAKSGADLRSGLEPITPNTDPRIDKRRNREGQIVPTVETAVAA